MSKRSFPALKAADLSDLLSGLLERAEENLSDDDLRSLHLWCGEDGVAMTSNLAGFMTSMAVLVASDADPDRGGPMAGSFWGGRTLPQLLFCLLNLAHQASAMLETARMAENMSETPRQRGSVTRIAPSTQERKS